MTPIFRSSRIVTFAYKIFIPIVLLVLLLRFYDFDFINPHFLKIFAIWGLIFSLLLFYICHIEVYNDYILIHRFFKVKKYEYDRISHVWECVFISPRVTIIFLNERCLLNRVIVGFSPIGFGNGVLLHSDPMISFIRDKIKSL